MSAIQEAIMAAEIAAGKLARRVAVGDQSLKLGTGGGAKVKADVGASHPPNMAHQINVGNLTSDGQH